MDRYALSARKKAVAGIVLGSLVALFAGFEASHVLKQRMLDDAQQALSERVAQLAIEVSGQTIHSPAMGATMLSGLGEVAFKSVWAIATYVLPRTRRCVRSCAPCAGFSRPMAFI